MHVSTRTLAVLLLPTLLAVVPCSLAFAQATERVSVSSAGAQATAPLGSSAPSVSADGRYVAFASDATNLITGDTNGNRDVFVRDRATGATQRVSVSSNGAQGDFASSFPSISADGRYVAFESLAFNLVAGDTNSAADIFVRDREAGATGRVSVSSAGAQGERCRSISPRRSPPTAATSPSRAMPPTWSRETPTSVLTSSRAVL
jgi:hypothetical protein